MTKEYIAKSFTFREEEYKLLEILAKMQDRSMSAVLRILVKEEAKRRGLVREVEEDKKDELSKNSL